MIKNILITIIILSFVLSLENYGQNRSKKIFEKETTQSSNKSKRETSVVREHNEPNKLLSLINNALELYKKKKYEEAIPIFREAILLAAESNDLEVRDKSNLEALLAVSLNNHASFLKKNVNYEEAENCYIESIKLFRKVHNNNDHLELAKNLKNAAIFFAEIGKNEKAEVLYKEALEMFRRIYDNSDNRDILIVLSGYAQLLSNIDRLDEAKKMNDEALTMGERIFHDKDDADLVLVLNNHALILIKIGNYSAAEEFIARSLGMARKLFKNDSPFLATVIGNTAQIYTTIGKCEIAEVLHNEALVMRKKIYKNNDHPDIALSLNNLALFYFQYGQYLKAEPMLKESLSMFERIYSDENNPKLGLVYSNAATLFQSMGKFSEAENLHTEAITILRQKHKNNTSYELASALNSAAIFYKYSAKIDEAENLLKESLQIKKRIFGNLDHPEIAMSLNNMAAILLTKGSYREALLYAKEAIDMYTKIKQGALNNYAGSLITYATILSYYERYEEAESHFKEALDIRNKYYNGKDHSDLVISLYMMAYVASKKGEYQTSEYYFNKAAEMAGRIYVLPHPDLALIIINGASMFQEENKISLATKYYLYSLEIYKDLIKNMFSYLTEKEKENFIANLFKAYASFNSFAIDQYQNNFYLLNAMYNTILMNKGVIGQSTLSIKRKILSGFDKNISILYEEWNKQKEILLNLYFMAHNNVQNKEDQINSILNKINNLEKEINIKSQNSLIDDNVNEITLSNIQTNLKKDEVAIELVRINYFIDGIATDRIYYAVLITTQDTTKHPEIVLLKNGLELESTLFKKYQDYITVSQYQEKEEEISDDGKLYDAFWGKIAEKIKGKTRVYLSSDGVYNQINVNALYNPNTKKYVIDETEIVLLTSTRELAVEKKEREYDNRAELFGFPNYDLGVNEQKEIAQEYDLKRKRLLEGVRLTELPGTRIEIEESGNILQQNKWVVNEYLGDNALEENLKKINSPRLLHIATHGVFLEEEQIEREKKFSFGMMGDQQKIYYDNPLLRSALFLSGANRSRKGINVEGVEDGVFTGYEAQNLNLMNTELVILSACETGLGVIKSGEGVYGLQRAFRVAGAENIIMSLWKVSDEATKDLILNFYNKWTKGKSVKEAFLEAQRELREKYPGAFYWAAFVLIGG